MYQEPFANFQVAQEDKDIQLAYVEEKYDLLGFNTAKVRWLPAQKRHLLKNPDGSSFGEH